MSCVISVCKEGFFKRQKTTRRDSQMKANLITAAKVFHYCECGRVCITKQSLIRNVYTHARA